MRARQSELWILLDTAEHRLHADHPDEWTLGADLLRDAGFDAI